MIILLAPALLVISAVFVFPVGDVVRLSLYHQSLFGGVRRFVGLDNYTAVLQGNEFWPDLVNTIIWTVGTVVFEVGLGLLTALVLLERHLINRIIRPLILIPWVLSGVVVASLWKWLLDASPDAPINAILSVVHLGPVGWLAQPGWAMASVIMTNVWKSIPFIAVMYLAGLSAISADLYEAAAIDGANTVQQFWSITLPSLRGVTSVLILLATIWTVTFFDVIYAMTAGGPAFSTETLALLVYRTAFQNVDYGSGAAVAVLLALINAVFLGIYAVVLRRGQAVEA